MAFVILSCLLGLILAVYWIFIRTRKKYRLPPGPKGVPIFGNFLQLDKKKFALELHTIGKDFADAHSVKLFTQNVVILKSSDLINEAIVSPKYARIFSGRPVTFLGKYVLHGDVAMQTYSEEWAGRKRLVLRGVKTYGTHSKEAEDLVHEELKRLVSRIEKEAGSTVDPWEYTGGYFRNIAFMLLTGQHLKYDDPLLKICGQITAHMDFLLEPGISALMTSFPWLRKLPISFGNVYQELMKEISVLRNAVLERKKGDECKRPCFLDYLQEEKNKGNLSDESFSSIFINVVTGGIGSSHSSTYTLMLTLTSRPEIQNKIQNEIDREIGSRLPCLEDRQRLPYTQAVLLEALRLTPASPLGLPHSIMEDVEIRDYILPKDTLVYYSRWDIHHDETFWKEPWTFNPDRFLDETGNLVPPEDEKRQRMIAFGLGKRVCIAEVLARQRIFSFIATVMQKFSLVPDPQFPLPDTDPSSFEFHQLLTCPRYKIVFQPRK